MGKRKSKKEKSLSAREDHLPEARVAADAPFEKDGDDGLGGGDDLGDDQFVGGGADSDSEDAPGAAPAFLDAGSDSDGPDLATSSYGKGEISEISEAKEFTEGETDREVGPGKRAAKGRSGGVERLREKRRRLNAEYAAVVASVPTQPAPVQSRYLQTLVSEKYGSEATPLEMSLFSERVAEPRIHAEAGEKLHQDAGFPLLFKRVKGWNAALHSEARGVRVVALCGSKQRCAALVSAFEALYAEKRSKNSSTGAGASKNGDAGSKNGDAGASRGGAAARKVGKIFGKRDKGGQGDFLAKARVSVCVGTPGRFASLTESGSIDLSQLEILVIDMFRDAKGNTVLDGNDTRDAAVEFIAKRTNDACRIVLF